METSIFKHIRELSTQPRLGQNGTKGSPKVLLMKEQEQLKIYCLVFMMIIFDTLRVLILK